MADGYRGVIGAVPYAFRSSDSWLFRSYVLVSALTALAVSLLFVFGIVVLIAETAAVEGGSLTLSRAFYVVIALLIVAPIIAPTLLVARRYRRERSRRPGYDARLALAGYLFLAALYVGLVIAVPPGARESPGGALAPVVRALYSLPRPAGAVPPLVAVVLMILAHRRG